MAGRGASGGDVYGGVLPLYRSVQFLSWDGSGHRTDQVVGSGVRGFPEAVRAAFRDDNRGFAAACFDLCIGVLQEAYSEGAVAFPDMVCAVCPLSLADRGAGPCT